MHFATFWVSFLLSFLFTGAVSGTSNHGEFSNVVTILKQPTTFNRLERLREKSGLPGKCGDVHNSTIGSIFYKPYKAVGENERCAWIIAVPGAIGYGVTIEYLGNHTNQQNSGQMLVLTGFRYGSIPELTSYMPVSTGDFPINEANLIVVTFHSSMQQGEARNGFVLRYSSTHQLNFTETSLKSTHHFIYNSTYELKYPPTENDYESKELAAFIFLPNDNTYTGTDSHIWFKSNLITESCTDALYVFMYNANAANGSSVWEENGRLCHEDSKTQLVHDDIVLMLFRSGSTRNAGFWLSLTHC